jgi:hypothetical protein
MDFSAQQKRQAVQQILPRSGDPFQHHKQTHTSVKVTGEDPLSTNLPEQKSLRHMFSPGRFRALMVTGLFVLASALLAAALPVQSAQAQYFGKNKAQYEQFDWRTFETEHFTFYFYPDEKKAVRDAAQMAERWYARHTQVFQHRFEEKKPIILYANGADFRQTSVIDQPISQGTGGFTEPMMERVVMPLTTSYGETSHVLGHELVHSFHFDIGLNGSDGNFSLQNLPAWLIEGMAEYLSVGRRSTHTTMWLRDAVRRGEMPSFEELSNPREYFPYRYGHAFLAYIGGKYGDPAVTDLFKQGGRKGLGPAIQQLFGVSPDSLAEEWAQATKEAYLPSWEERTAPDSAGTES